MLDEDFTAKLSYYDLAKLVTGYYPLLDEPFYTDDYYPGCEPILLQTNLSGFRVVFAEILTGERISFEKDIKKIDSFFVYFGKTTLTDLAGICFTICNEMDSEAQMLTILQDHDKLIRKELKRWLETKFFW